jgi:hypothetical protein
MVRSLLLRVRGPYVGSYETSRKGQASLNTPDTCVDLLPFEATVRLVRDHDFGGSFPGAAIQPLFDFVETWDPRRAAAAIRGFLRNPVQFRICYTPRRVLRRT